MTVDHQSAASGNREIIASRVFGAPRELVFRAFSDPSLLARWWGPKGFTNTFREFDFRPGGAWRFVMLGDEACKTRLTWVMQFESAEEAEKVRSLVAEANEQNFDRLEAQLATMACGD